MKKISIIGAGSWGCTVAQILAAKNLPVQIWARNPDISQEINIQHTNKKYLGDIKLAPSLQASDNLRDVLRKTSLVVLAIPAQHLRSVLLHKPFLSLAENIPLVNLAKGIETKSFHTMSKVIKEVLPHSKYVFTLSGPNIAHEILLNKPTATVIAGNDTSVLDKVRSIFHSQLLITFSTTDIVGVELGGSLKNVIALAAGACDGLEIGINGKSSIITRGLAEIMRLGVRMGAAPLTFTGLSGMGDLVATCNSRKSRNHTVGVNFAHGTTLQTIEKELGGMVAEGIPTTKAVFNHSQKLGINMPITEQIYKVIYKNKPIEKAIKSLLSFEGEEEIKL